MKKFKKKFLLTGLALAVPLVGVIASACSEVGQVSPTPPPGGNNREQGGQNRPTGSGGSSGGSSTGSGSSTMMKSNNNNILEHLPSFF